jgi:deoxyribonuclease-4
MRPIGVHTSIAGGIELSLERARDLGCTTLQIFSHNPRQWLVPSAPDGLFERFRELRRSLGLAPVYVHTSYLINLAATDGQVLARSKKLLAKEMELADLLDADYVVLHTGTARDGEREGRARATNALREVLKGTAHRSRLLLENTAGERGDISSRMSDLAGIMNGVASPVIGGVCIDTCHAFAAGYNIAEREGLAALVGEIKEHLGLGTVKLIHLNDAKKGLNSRVDRHEHIGEGQITSEGFMRFLGHPAFAAVPVILETPKKTDEDDLRNLRLVRQLIGQGSGLES